MAAPQISSKPRQPVAIVTGIKNSFYAFSDLCRLYLHTSISTKKRTNLITSLYYLILTTLFCICCVSMITCVSRFVDYGARERVLVNTNRESIRGASRKVLKSRQYTCTQCAQPQITLIDVLRHILLRYLVAVCHKAKSRN